MWVMKLGYAHKQDKDRQLVPGTARFFSCLILRNYSVFCSINLS